MSGDVTYCIKCGACNWAGIDRCRVCGGELEPTLAQVHAFYYQTDTEFKKMVDENHKALGRRE